MPKILSFSLDSASCRQSLMIPTYTITRRADLSLQFQPPVGSRELANALSIKYPFAESLQKQIDHAILDYIASEQALQNPKIPLCDRPFENLDDQPPSIETPIREPSPLQKNSLLITPHSTGKSAKKGRKRSKFDPDKRRKVARVRKTGACAYHRKKKTECKCTLNQNSHEQQQNSKPPSEQETTTVTDRNDSFSPTVYSTIPSNDYFKTLSMTTMPPFGYDIAGTYDFSFFDSISSPGVQDLSFHFRNNAPIWNTTTLSFPFTTPAISEAVEEPQLDPIPSTMSWSQAIQDDATRQGLDVCSQESVRQNKATLME